MTETLESRALTYLKELSKGLRYQDVGDLYGCSGEAVRNVIRRYNAKTTGEYAGISSMLGAPEPKRLIEYPAPSDPLEVAEEILQDSETSGPNIVTIDIERLPRVVFEWSPRHREGWTPEHMVIESSRMVSFAAKPLGGPVIFASEFHHSREKMLETLWHVMDQASVIVSYNGSRFDVPHIDGELRDAGYKVYSPFKQIDLLSSIKRRFAYDYKTMKSVASRWGLSEAKQETGGFDLWRRCYEGDQEAWDQMREYNKQDVRVTEAMFLDNLSWLTGSIPNMGLWVPSVDGMVCPACGSNDVVKDGHAVTGVTKYVAYRCGKCGYRSRSNERVQSTILRPVTW